ncbi:hypothetical protein ABZW44_50705, partial [Streptomyces mirabilis]|uniref:hypothetical protein n=1 Tax=Streptomyces mirabilis TaxID=68239 RepID=UPI0033A5E157
VERFAATLTEQGLDPEDYLLVPADDLLQGSAGRFGAGRGRHGALGAAVARAPRQRRRCGGDQAAGRLLTGE